MLNIGKKIQGMPLQNISVHFRTIKNANRVRGGGWVLHVIAHTRRLRPKGVGSLDVEVYERVGKTVVYIFYRALN